MSDGFLLRIRYRITGRLAYLSHLETIRSIERIVRRAGLPFAITEGFNPHMKIAFGPALPVGAGSQTEYVDVRLKDYVEPRQALEALQAAAPTNLMPLACEYVPVGSDAIDVAYPVSVWHVELDVNGLGLAEVKRGFDRLLEHGHIEVKKTKGRKETIKRIAFDGRLVDGPRLSEEDEGENPVVKVEFSTYQGNEGALRPDKFVAAAIGLMDVPATVRSLSRKELKPV